MAKVFSYEEVQKHTSSDSCWVILYGKVYDISKFLPEHPGGSKVILQLAGQDATEEYDPIHPPGTLEENLDASALLGTIDPATLPANKVADNADETEKDEDGDVEVDMKSVLNLDEMEDIATKRIPGKAWAYYYSAGDDLFSKKFNNTVYRNILLRPRIFVDCTRCSTSTSLLGQTVGTPLFVSPAAMARLGHPAGEKGIAEGISRFGAVQIISNNASMTPEQIVADSAPGQIFGWQLYVQNERAKSEKMLQRINALASQGKVKFVVLTLDAAVPGKREDDERGGPILPKKKKSKAESKEEKSHASKDAEGKTIEGGGGVGKQLFTGTAADLTWKPTLAWLAQHTTLPIVLKGIQTHEDAYLAMQHAPQVRGIILSNHGGRALDTAPPAVHTLLEIRKYCPEVLSKIEVWVDGGIRRGTDIVKALCLGARAVGVGRAALFGLGAGGVEGVDRTFEILQGEVETCMRLLGVEKISQLGLRHVNARAVERDLYDGDAGLQKLGLWVKASL